MRHPPPCAQGRGVDPRLWPRAASTTTVRGTSGLSLSTAPKLPVVSDRKWPRTGCPGWVAGRSRERELTGGRVDGMAVSHRPVAVLRPGAANDRNAAVQVYFCDPRSPRQRGSNENTNGLLRQYLPKGIDIFCYLQSKLNGLARQLNERPRKTLGGPNAAEMFSQTVALAS